LCFAVCSRTSPKGFRKGDLCAIVVVIGDIYDCHNPALKVKKLIKKKKFYSKKELFK
jgi:hypothetical protein